MNQEELDRLSLFFYQATCRNNEAIEQQIPKVSLGERHVRYCQLLLNRAEMLKRLPKYGICAEIGVDRGEFSEQILKACSPERLHLVDTWGSDRYHDGLLDNIRARLGETIDKGGVVIHHKLSVAAAQDFPDGYFDWIYIDTSHMYDATRDELRAYAPKMKPGGIIAGHDYTMGNWVDVLRYGVIEAVHEFCVEAGWEMLYLTAEPIEKQSFAIRRIAD